MDRKIINYYKAVAKQLLYPDEVLDAIKKAKTEEEISRILREARIQSLEF